MNVQFANNVTASFTMTAFDTGRNIDIFGTKACLRGGEVIKKQCDTEIIVTNHATNEQIGYPIEIIEGGYEGHGGGDFGLINELYHEMSRENPEDMKTSINASVVSHIIGFAAEESMIKEETVFL